MEMEPPTEFKMGQPTLLVFIKKKYSTNGVSVYIALLSHLHCINYYITYLTVTFEIFRNDVLVVGAMKTFFSFQSPEI